MRNKPKQEDYKSYFGYITALETQNAELEKENKDLKNELCLKCGKYKEAHMGACDNCKWKDK